jgi:alkanesulfonate monooxygenase SsuD/methylene tetrahydromethanopterin reductase-like flavin-dependent oxidoreductase (luciferase family)
VTDVPRPPTPRPPTPRPPTPRPPAPRPPLHLAVALDGAGWHPAAWREPLARPRDLLTAGYWAGLVAEAEAGLLDFVTLEDALSLQSMRRLEPDGAADQVRGRLDAVLIAARVAPLTRHVGLIPTVVVTHTEPFHISKAIATLDYVSGGRAGVRVRVSSRPDEAAHFGRRAVAVTEPRDAASTDTVSGLFDEAADYVEVIRRLWDSWEDDAEIRDVATGRFVDRGKLHYIDFEGRWFSVRGPSITPRPPQGQPPVAALAHSAVPYQLVARSADLGFVTPHDAGQAAQIVAEIRAAEADAARPGTAPGGTGWPGGPLEPRPGAAVLADLLVYLDEGAGVAAARRDRLDERWGRAYRSDAEIFAGTPGELADLMLDWQHAGLAGYRLRPATLPHDLTQITRGLVPELQRRDAFRRGYEGSTLRQLLRLARPASRYAAR